MDRSETVLELTYRTQIGRFLAVQPNLQWVVNPGINPDLVDALVLGLRSQLRRELPGDGRSR
jgi:porin